MITTHIVYPIQDIEKRLAELLELLPEKQERLHSLDDSDDQEEWDEIDELEKEIAGIESSIDELNLLLKNAKQISLDENDIRGLNADCQKVILETDPKGNNNTLYYFFHKEGYKQALKDLK